MRIDHQLSIPFNITNEREIAVCFETRAEAETVLRFVTHSPLASFQGVCIEVFETREANMFRIRWIRGGEWYYLRDECAYAARELSRANRRAAGMLPLSFGI